MTAEGNKATLGKHFFYLYRDITVTVSIRQMNSRNSTCMIDGLPDNRRLSILTIHMENDLSLHHL